ncbi:hypothetical protein MCEMRE203_00203 [Candidatus Nanopelagicaceae bacterium]
MTGLLISLAIALIPAAAISAPKVTPGTTCKVFSQKVVYQNKTYTCIKSGKKSVWSKGVAVVKPTPTSTSQKIAFTPWSTEFDTESMIRTALDGTATYFGTVRPNTNYEITIDPVIAAADRAWIKTVTDYVSGMFDTLEKEKLIVFVGSTRNWALQELKSQNLWIGDPSNPVPCSAQNDDSACADRNKILILFSAQALSTNDPGNRFLYRTTIAHEIFHAIQYALSPNVGPGEPKRIPQWLTEGSPTYLQFYVGEKLGFDKYQTGRTGQVNSNFQYKTTIPLRSYEGNRFEGETLNPYGIGQVATEYIIASIGFEKFLNIWRFTKTEGSFASGFEKATGLELDDFYTKFEAARSSMQIGF